jgi:chromosome partitioning protein
MILVCGGIKGGSGKTTLAINLTVMRAATGKKVLLVDADEQKSSSDWVEQREAMGIKTAWTTVQLSGKAIHSQLVRFKEDYDDIIVDVGGRDTTSQRSALTVADVFLIPFKPRSLDIWTIGSVKNMVSEIVSVNPNLKCLSVINQGDSRGTDNDDSIKILKECPEITCLKCTIGHRKSFSNAAAQGFAVSELISDKKAAEELKKLYASIYKK